MKRKIKRVSIILLLLIVLIFIIIKLKDSIIDLKELDMQKEEFLNPIDLNTHIINNDYFSINSEGDDPKNTTKGINEAIEYANKNNINYIKLKKGIYKIEYSGIVFKSNITLDLNGSQIVQNTTDKEAYYNFVLRNVNNVVLYNGIIIGDKENHDFSSNPESTHEWGHGIEIFGGDNITIANLQICDMIGDGIYITSEDNDNPSNIKISNINIFNCRRQGISIISGQDIEISDCEIHNIAGTKPQSGIDLESNEKEQVINNIYIQNNKFYNFEENNAIFLVGNVYNCYIEENYINGNILVNDAKESLKIGNNEIEKGDIQLLSSYSNINIGHDINNVLMQENRILGGNIIAQKVNNANILNNEINTGNVRMISSNGKVEKNIVKNDSTTEMIQYAFIFSKISGHTETYFSTFKENTMEGNIDELVKIDQDSYIVSFN